MILALSSVAAHESDLARWGSIWAIVAGVVAVLLVLWNVARWAWDRSHRPKLVIECGSGPRFDRQMALTLEEVQIHGDPRRLPDAAFAKVLTVRETKGRAARNVSVLVLAVEPGHDPQVSIPVALHWQGAAMSETVDIPPGGHKDIVFQTMIVYGPPWEFFLVSPFGLTPPTKIQLGVFINGRKHTTETFQVTEAWAREHSVRQDTGLDLLERFPYPSLASEQATP